MDTETKSAFAAYWAKQENTKSQLRELGLALNNPVELSVNDTTDEMVAECLRHCEEHGLVLMVNEETGAWEQGFNVVGTDTPPDTSGEQKPDTPPDTPEDAGDKPAETASNPEGGGDNGLALMTPAREQDDALTELEQLFTLPPAHQNHLTPGAIARAKRGRELVAFLRELAEHLRLELELAKNRG